MLNNTKILCGVQGVHTCTIEAYNHDKLTTVHGTYIYILHVDILLTRRVKL